MARRTLDLGKLPIPRYTRLSSRCTSVRIILSSSRFSSVSSVSIRDSAALYCSVSSCLEARVFQCNPEHGRIGEGSQANQASFEALLEEYPLLSLRPFDVILQHGDLYRLAVRDRVEEVEEGADFMYYQSGVYTDAARSYALSFAVFAFAVDDMNDRESVMTSATPFAFLQVPCIRFHVGTYSRIRSLLIAVELTKLDQRGLLVPECLLLALIVRAGLSQDLLVEHLRLLRVCGRRSLRLCQKICCCRHCVPRML